ncbi:MAG: hypothetical protein FWF46_09360 [Oscillospiraceae bacterium]|nr:hypothetical protein [Oscillospiraceae bacterium]
MMNFKRILIMLLIAILIMSVGIYVYASNQKSKGSKVKFMEEMSNSFETVIKTNKKDKSINVNKKGKQIKYKETKMGKDVYVSDNDEEYIYKDDNLVGFMEYTDIDNVQLPELNIEIAQKVADEYLKENIENYQKYELIYSHYTPSYATHTFIYMNKLNGLDTSDTVRIEVDNASNIVSLAAFNQGEFEKYKDTVIDMKVIEPALTEMIKNKYGNDYVSSEITYYCLTIIEDKLFLQVDVSIVVNTLENIKVSDVIMYELS